MTSNASAEGDRMAKIQKTFYLNADLCERIADTERRTGANFTRQVTAAILCYLYGHTATPSPAWMTLAVELDKGNIAPGEVHQRFLEEEHRRLRPLLGDLWAWVDAQRAGDEDRVRVERLKFNAAWSMADIQHMLILIDEANRNKDSKHQGGQKGKK